MYELETTKDELQAAARMASIIALENIFLVRAQVENRLPRLRLKAGRTSGDVAGLVGFGHRYLGHELFKPDRLLVETSTSVNFQTTDSGNEITVAEILVVYCAQYVIGETELPEAWETDEVPAFARLNGLYNCWPYFRSEVSRISAEMDLPFLLPVLRVVPTPTASELKGLSFGPGEAVPKTAHYRVLGPRGGRTKRLVELKKGQEFPVAPSKGSTYQLESDES